MYSMELFSPYYVFFFFAALQRSSFLLHFRCCRRLFSNFLIIHFHGLQMLFLLYLKFYCSFVSLSCIVKVVLNLPAIAYCLHLQNCAEMLIRFTCKFISVHNSLSFNFRFPFRPQQVCFGFFLCQDVIRLICRYIVFVFHLHLHNFSENLMRCNILRVFSD